MTSFEVKPIGRVASPLTDLGSAPLQADEDAPEAWLVFDPEVLEGLRSLRSGDEVIVITWLDRARRDVLSVHPRGDPSRAQEGVFSTRSPHRPNPVGLHRVEITAIDGRRVRVRQREVLDGTPIIDVKPILSGEIGQRRIGGSAPLRGRMTAVRAVRKPPADGIRRPLWVISGHRTADRDVRFTPDSRHAPRANECLLSATSRHRHYY